MNCPTCLSDEKLIQPQSGLEYSCGTMEGGEPTDECMRRVVAEAEGYLEKAVRAMSRMSFTKRQWVRCDECGMGMREVKPREWSWTCCQCGGQIEDDFDHKYTRFDDGTAICVACTGPKLVMGS